MEQLGWVQLHRKFIDWEWYTDTNTKVLFIHCLLKANHKDAKWRGHTIKRGQFLSSLNHLSQDTGLSVRNIRTSLKHLESTGDVTREATSQVTKLTICNYDTYNNFKPSTDKPTDKQATSDRQASDKRVTTNNNDNNKNNNKTIEERAKEFKKLTKDKWNDLGGENYLRSVEAQKFFEYWTECGDNDKKMRFEKQSSFGIGRRLGTWKANNKQSYSEGRNNA